MKILVTGGAGFIGSNLTQFLVERGDEVTVLDTLSRGNKISQEILRHVELVKGDIRDYEIVKLACKNKDCAFHLAAVLGVDIVADNPMETMEVEALGMQHLVESCIIAGVSKIVYASTSGVYGKKLIESSVTENVSLDPVSSYSIAKRHNEIYLAAAFQEKGLHSISTRLFNVYGPKQDERMVIPRFVKQALRHEPITVYGTGKQTRDFTYVLDVVKAMVQLAERVDGAEIFNISRGDEVSIMHVAQTVKRLLNSRSEIVTINAPKARYDFEVDRRLGNSEKLKKFIGFIPETNFIDGLKLTYDDLALSTQ